jgi:hypothetical protein
MGNTFTMTPASGSGNADGYYVERAQVILTAGTDNFNQAFNLDNDSLVADEDVVQQVFDLGDQYVDSRALVLGVTAANATHYIADDDDVYTFLRYWASRWARAQGYLLRGTNRDATAEAQGQMQAMKEEAEERIDQLLGTKVTDGAGVSGFEFVTKTADTCVDDENAAPEPSWGTY